MFPEVSVSGSDERLIVSVQSSMRCWNIFIGCVASGIGTALFKSDCSVCSILCFGAVFVIALWLMEGYKEAAFDKSSGRLTVTELSFLQKWFSCCCPGKCATYALSDITSIQVRSEDASVVVLNKSAQCICKLYVSSPENSQLVSRIQKFLNIEPSWTEQQEQQHVPPQLRVQQGSNVEADDVVATELVHDDAVASSPLTAAAQADDASSVTSSEESFERVSAADFADFDAGSSAALDDLSPTSQDEDGETGDISVNQSQKHD